MIECLSQQDFTGLVEGSASAEQVTAWKRHLRVCDSCATHFVQMQAGPENIPEGKVRASSRQNVGDELHTVGGLEPNIQIGDFRIEKRLGSGGMGTVYQAVQLSLNRHVALKVLPPSLANSRVAVKRFHREAQAAAKLHHTNIVAIYAEGEENGTCYYAMEMIEGQSLDQIIDDFRAVKANRAELDTSIAMGGSSSREQPDLVGSERINSKTAIALSWSGSEQRYFDTIAHLIADVADALYYAHKKGVIHRDVKPSNLMLGSDGRLSLMDFGVARMLEDQGITTTGSFIGTPHYMSPEQITSTRGKLDHRTDIYSLGVTLYELLTLELLFTGDNREQIIAQILNKEPRRPRQLDGRIPVDLETICCKALEKEPNQRYQTAGEFAEDLRRYVNRYAIRAKRSGPVDRIVKFVRRHKLPVAMAAVIALAITMAGLTAWKYFTSQWAQKHAIPEIRRLIDKGKYFDAFELARKAESFVRGDPTLAALWPEFSDTMSIDTAPSGAQIYIKRYNSTNGKWIRLGKSPIGQIRLARGLYRWKLTKLGYATLEVRRPTSNRAIDFHLDEKDKIPAGMVRVSGGRFSLLLTGMHHHEMKLKDFFIDQYEVTNKQFKEFMDSSGYRNQKYWKHEFIKEGIVLSWSDAIQEFHDQTDTAGPSGWKNGTYPVGQDNYPVGGVSWYEAAAYAEFVGKRLPTIYHWSNAGITGGRYSGTILPYSNFDQEGPASVGYYQGMGNYGTYDMAGNMMEWCWNRAGDNKRYILGGAWNEPEYKFVVPAAFTPFDRSTTNGFRCVKYISDTDIPKVAFDQVVSQHRDYNKETPISDEKFLIYKTTLYSYDKDGLNEVVVAVDDTPEYWIHETITFDAAYGGERVIVHLYLPRNVSPPYQTVIYFPGNSALFLHQYYSRGLPDFLLRSGRAVLYPIYKGTYERNDGLRSNRPTRSLSYRDHVIWWSKDLSRSIDYLELREDIDHEKLGFFGLSWCGAMGAILPAVENRLKVCVLVGGGFYFERSLSEVDQINFAPHVKIPVLMINGRYDGALLVDKSQRPMFELLGTSEKDKRHLLFDSGHLPREHVNEETLKWLERYLGPVRKKADEGEQ
jgi:serine/threonine protein kinase/formylglycine-generating enzyme required for sulfatase activity/cephalosporin-C deacetylase-like acetyl esterase